MALLLAPVAGAEELSPVEGYRLVQQLMDPERKARKQASEALVRAGDETLIPAMVDALFFTPRANRGELVKTLQKITGEDRSAYREWIEYIGSRTDVVPKDRYPEWKVAMYRRIDGDYEKVFYAGVPAHIRLEEILSGGVPLDGIPSLDDPPIITADEAGYLKDDERVFGVERGGESRAYPLRFLSWHEMLNDTVGGEPVTLSFCTLCGSGILYSSRVGGATFRFGTSGLLYRSNKLMFDRQTHSLWSNITGAAVVGRQAAKEAQLEILPMTLTTWEEWRRRHPDTTTIDLKAVQRQFARTAAFDYKPGAADRARAGVSFPVWLQDDALERDAEIFALEIDGAAKAYPLDPLLAAGVVNDELGGKPLVLVADAASEAVRAYERRGHTFTAAGDGGVVDETGGRWRLTEAALEPEAGGEPLARVPGHVAFWFGWYAFYPGTEIWGQ